MPSIRKIVCPACQAGLKIAVDLPAGKRIRCPKCLEAFPQSAAADWVPRAKAVAVAAGPDARRFAEESIYEEEEQQPTPPDGEEKKKKWVLNRPLVLGLSIGGAVLLLGAVVTLAIVRPWESKKPQFVANTTRPSGPARPGRGRRPLVMEGATSNDRQQPAKAPAPADSDTGETLPAPAGKVPSEAVPMQLMAGKKVYDSLDCSRCHAIGTSSGSGFRKGPRGPNLARIGADSSHTVDWVSEQIRNPRSHRPGSRMPPYGEDKISREDLRSLAEYLASLK